MRNECPTPGCNRGIFHSGSCGGNSWTTGGVPVTITSTWEQIGMTACGTVYVTDNELKLDEGAYREIVRERMQRLWDSAMELWRERR